MKSYVCLLPLLCCLFMISGCSSKQVPKSDWAYEKDSITMRFKASPLLNLTDNSPHTLMVCLYQLRNKSMFEQLVANEDGIYQLLDCESYNSSVNNVERVYVHPGQELSVVMNRLAGTRYLGIVAGYYVLEKERMIRIIDIPTVITEHSKLPSIVTKKSAHAAKLNLVINLGSEQIAAIQKY